MYNNNLTAKNIATRLQIYKSFTRLKVYLKIAFDTQCLSITHDIEPWFYIRRNKAVNGSILHLITSHMCWIPGQQFFTIAYLFQEHPRKERIVIWMFPRHLGTLKALMKALRYTAYGPAKDRIQTCVHSRQNPLQIL